METKIVHIIAKFLKFLLFKFRSSPCGLYAAGLLNIALKKQKSML